MKKTILSVIFTIFAIGAILFGQVGQVTAQDATPTLQPTIAPSATEEDPTPYTRPVVVIQSFSIGKDAVRPGTNFDLRLTFVNSGGSDASNIIAVFDSTDFLPQETGGVGSIPWIPPTGDRTIEQPMLASDQLWGLTVGIVTVRVTYTDTNGSTYSENFTLAINIEQPNWAPNPTKTPTPFNTLRPQLVIDTYASSVDPLQPGTIFNLSLDVRNLGTANAKGVTMVLGGGTVADNGSGTPQPGGVSGSGSDLSTFAPLGSSNLLFLGDLEMGKTLSADPRLIVNVSANPGAYPFKVSFIYNDEKGNRIVDDQVITLLIYSLPAVDVSFYRDPGEFFANGYTQLPLQVTNMGRKSAVLGSMKVIAQNGDATNNVALVGVLDPGGYFTLDVDFVPFAAGPMDVEVTISYTDDFNQPRTISQIIPITVQEEQIYIEPEIPLGPDGLPLPPEPVEETFGQKVLRFLKGLIGLDSAPPEPQLYPADMLAPEEEKPAVVPGPKG